METNSGETIQGQVLGRGDATSPYTVLGADKVIEFVEGGDVTCTLETGGNTVTEVLSGSRYSIGNGVTIITFSGKFNIG